MGKAKGHAAVAPATVPTMPVAYQTIRPDRTWDAYKGSGNSTRIVDASPRQHPVTYQHGALTVTKIYPAGKDINYAVVGPYSEIEAFWKALEAQWAKFNRQIEMLSFLPKDDAGLYTALISNVEVLNATR